MLAYKTYCGGTERTWQQPPICGPLPTSHALETPDKTLTLEEGREGVGMKKAASAGQILLQQLCPAQEGTGGAKSLLKIGMCVCAHVCMRVCV